MVTSDNVGVFVPDKKGKALEFSSSLMKEQDSYLVPMEQSAKALSTAVVKVGDKVLEGSVIGKPCDRHGVFIYSPVSGKVANIVQQLSLSGNIVDHVLIIADKKNNVQRFPILEQMDRKTLLERLMVSGIIDDSGEPDYIKYVRKPIDKTRLIVSCVDNDPYLSSSEVTLRENISACVKGAESFMSLCGAPKITFVCTVKQKSVIREFKKYIKENKTKHITVDVIKNVYPLSVDEITRYSTGKTLDAAGRHFMGLYIESVITCKQFFDCIYKGIPAISRMVTVTGSGFVRKGNYEIKIGTTLKAVADFVGVNPSQNYKMICGGVLNGQAQESNNVSVSASVPGIIFLTQKDLNVEKESPCINCGKCSDICPAKILPYKLEKFIQNGDYDFAKRYGLDACTSCGACSYICPAKRYLSQRITDAKNKLDSVGGLK